MKIESGFVDANRKFDTIDYTISTMNDHGSSEALQSLEHQRNKCELSNGHQCDPYGDQTENVKNGLDKKNENNHNAAPENNGKRQKTLCYDFKKGFCRRRFCRYPHAMSLDQVVFCHDFQNNGCFRSNCRFIHRSVEDEEHYRQYGVFPLPSERQLPPTNLGQPEHQMMNQPQMMNYHPNRENNMIPNQHPGPNGFSQNSVMPQHSRRRSFCISDMNGDPVVPMKRQHMDDLRTSIASNSTPQCQNTYESNMMNQSINVPATTAPNSVVQVQSSVAPSVSAPQVTSVVIGEDVINIFRLYEEYNMLRRRVEMSEERYQELRATNSYIIQQMEQMRRQTQCSCTNTIVNPVTLTTASQQSAAPQVLNAVSIAPVQMQATPIVSIASIAPAQTQIIASSAPLAIAANTTQGQQIALAGTQQTGQIIATPQITLATAPSMGITMNTSQPLAMSANATQPIISYPVMTHSILPH